MLFVDIIFDISFFRVPPQLRKQAIPFKGRTEYTEMLCSTLHSELGFQSPALRSTVCILVPRTVSM